MLPLIQEQVLSQGWLTEEELINFIAVSEGTPGPFAVNISTYVGMETGGPLGALCATLGVVLPSFVIILLVARCFRRFQQSRAVKGCMTGLKPAVIGLIGSAVVSAGETVLFPRGLAPQVFLTPSLIVSILIFAAMLILAFKKVHPIIIILLSGIIGVAAGYITV